ncbi:zinc ribbon domain-containing protein [Streptosporangium canum]|uniref:zinc ribbon domain-containing protein n=1 Tax=Streptosporangium canum TaxID=324952 RepID=UPI00368FA960
MRYDQRCGNGDTEPRARRAPQPGQGADRALGRAGLGADGGVPHLRGRRPGGRISEVHPHGTSRECHRCKTITPGSRESQSRFACKNLRCGWIGNADANAARNQLHRYNKAAGQVVTGCGDPPVGGSVKRQAPRSAARAAHAPRAAA